MSGEGVRGGSGDHWSRHVTECAVRVSDGPLPLPVIGGSQVGEFVRFSGLVPELVSYEGGGGRLREGDVLLEVQGQQVAGFTRRDVVAWLNHCCKGGGPVRIRVARGGLLGKDLRQHLNARFPKNSPDCELQNTVRDNLYLRTVPCTTRSPRDGEVNGVDYTFLSVEDFMILERSGNLLESGIYEGNHYGTPRPLEECPVQRPVSLPGIHPSSEGKRRRNRSSVEAMTAKIAGEQADTGQKSNVGREEEGALPENWEKAFTEDGEPYFIDHNTGTSQWLDPRPKNKKPVGECEEDELPYGWEKIDDPHYGTYYIDHVNKRTQYENPVALAKKISTSSLPDDSLQSQGVQWRGEKEQSHGAVQGDPKQRKEGGPPYSGLRGSGYRPPYVFTDNPSELEGAMLRTSLVKSPRGFGFTIVGGDDGDVREFLQVKAVTPHGPAWQDGKLDVGDVLVHINTQCVLGFSHQEVVSLFQSIPPGEMVHVGVCRGYPLPFDPEDPSHEIVLTNGVSNDHEDAARSAKSMPDLTAFQPREEKAADLISVEIVKGKGGFGFTIADSVYGQKVKKILDADRCQHLQEGDILMEIGGRSIRGLPHCEVVQLLKDCPCDQPARMHIHRSNKAAKMKSADDLGVRRSVSNNSCHSFPYRSPVADDPFPPSTTLYRSKTPTADLYSSKDKEVVSRPKTPLLDTRHWQKPHSVSSEPHDRPPDQRGWRADHPPALRTAYSAALDKTTVNPSWYTTLGKLRDTYWAADPTSKSSDFGQSSDALHYSYSQPKLPKANFNDSYEDSVFLSNNSWSSKNGCTTDHPGAAREWYPSDTSYPHSNSVRSSNGQPHFDRQQHFDRSSNGALPSSGHSPAGSSYDSLRRRGSSGQQPGGRGAAEYVDMVVTLMRQESGFGFRIVGGTEEGSQVAIGHLVPGGAAELDGRVRSGDEIVSVDGQPVVDTSHHRVVQLIGATAHSVTLGLRRRVSSVDSGFHTRSVENVYPYDVTITRQENEGFGFVIISSVSRAGATIGRIIEGSPADRCGRLQVGERVLSVNGASTLQLPHGDTVGLIKASGLSITLRVGPPLDPPAAQDPPQEYHALQLHRGAKGFGFSIRGGREFQNMPLFVLRIAEGGPAHVDGKLVVGDQIIEINGKNTKNMTHAQAIELIRQGNDSVRLLVRRGFNPQEGMSKLALDSDPFEAAMTMSSQGRLTSEESGLVNGGHRKNSFHFDSALQNDSLISQMPLNRYPQHHPPMLTSNSSMGGATVDKSRDYYAWNYEQH